MRYVYQGKLPFESAPINDRNLPDMHLALYTEAVVFDHATKLAYVVSWVKIDEYESIEEAYHSARRRLSTLSSKISVENAPNLSQGKVTLSLSSRPSPPERSNMTKEEFLGAVAATKEYIQSGDVFQLVLSQRFERRTFADPFEIYRSLRVVNPSPYMTYLQV